MSKTKGLRWSLDDNTKICEIVLKEYAVKKKCTPINDLVRTIELSQAFSKNSKKCKIQNIKYLYQKNHIVNCIPRGPLSHCSKNNEKAFLEVAKSLDLL